MSELPLSTSRRTALVLGLGVVGASVTGCDLQDLDPREPLPAPGTDTRSDPVPIDPDSDTTLVAEMVSMITAVSARVDAVRGRHRNLRGELGALARMHRAHLEVLDPQGEAVLADQDAAATGRSAVDRRKALQAERTLQRTIARAAESAQAGQVAKLLASVSASIAAHVAALEDAA